MPQTLNQISSWGECCESALQQLWLHCNKDKNMSIYQAQDKLSKAIVTLTMQGGKYCREIASELNIVASALREHLKELDSNHKDNVMVHLGRDCFGSGCKGKCRTVDAIAKRISVIEDLMNTYAGAVLNTNNVPPEWLKRDSNDN